MINMAILGAGAIAGTMASTISKMDQVCSYAVASRSLEKANAFAQTWGFEKAYGSYEEMVADPDVDLVYIATPHSHHYEHIKLCLSHQKHVLCEKAFTVNADQAKEVLALAKEKGLLLTEAIWTRYMPSRQIIQDTIQSGIIGTVHQLTANLGYAIWQKERITEPALAGGALLDLGIYPLNFACMVFGTAIRSIEGTAVLTDKGVDSQNSMTIVFENGSLATLHSSTLVVSDRKGFIYGDRGYLEVENINNPQWIKVYDNHYQLQKTIPVPEQISGYEYEVEACIRAIEAGDTQCSQMPHEETIRMMQLMDELRKQWGIVYPME